MFFFKQFISGCSNIQSDAAQLVPAGLFVRVLVYLCGVALIYSSVCQTERRCSEVNEATKASIFTLEATLLMVHD